MSQMTKPTRKTIIVAGVAIVVVALMVVLAWTAARGGKATIDGPTVRRLVAEDVLAVLSEKLGVTEDEASDLYEEKRLLEVAQENDVTRSDLVVSVREALVASLQQATENEEITPEQAEIALKMATRAITNHL